MTYNPWTEPIRSIKTSGLTVEDKNYCMKYILKLRDIFISLKWKY